MSFTSSSLLSYSFILLSILSSIPYIFSLPTIPSWTAPRGDPTKPLGGFSLVPNTTYSLVYNASLLYGTYNHAAMITSFKDTDTQSIPSIFIYWKNSPSNEDSPGQRILWSLSNDAGTTWSKTDGSNILFPNMSTNTNPAALFAEPFIWLNGHGYAAASPTQFCLYPDQYSSVLLLRRVYTNQTGLFGPIFWASTTIPPAFQEASILRGVVDLTSMDIETQQDIALLTPTAMDTPCNVPFNVTNKCEACSRGCQDWSLVKNMSNERTHYITDQGDILLYRSNQQPILFASVRSTNANKENWTSIVPTNIPNDEANINTGRLPDGRYYLLANAMPYKIRDPLTIATSLDGIIWNTCSVVMTCTANLFNSCTVRYPGLYKGPGPSYPQGVVIPSLNSMFVVATNNKEDVVVARLLLSSI